MTLAAGKQVTATLGGVSSTGTDLTFQLSADKLTAGYYVTVTGRRTAAAGEYREDQDHLARIGHAGTDPVRRGHGDHDQGRERSPASPTRRACRCACGSQVFGTSPTTVRAKVWPASGSEPSAWQQSVTDSTAGLQEAGSIALTTYLTGSATNGPIVGRVSAWQPSPLRDPWPRQALRPLSGHDKRAGQCRELRARPDVVLTTVAASRVTSTSIVFADSYREATASSMEVRAAP